MSSNHDTRQNCSGPSSDSPTIILGQGSLANSPELSEEMRTMLLREVERFNYERKLMFEHAMNTLKGKIKRGFIPSINELRRPLHWVDPDSQEGKKAISDIRGLLKKKGPLGSMRANQLEFTVKADALNSMLLYMESNIKRGNLDSECTPEKVEALRIERSKCLKLLSELNKEDETQGETISMYKSRHPVMAFVEDLGRLVADYL